MAVSRRGSRTRAAAQGRFAHVARAHTDSEDRNTLVLFDVSYEVWIRAFDHWLKAVLPEATYSLRGPLPDGDTERSGDTDEHGDLRERYLPCGEYLLQIGEGEAVVAARLMEEIGAGDGGRGTGSVTWPDAIRVRGVEAPAGPGATGGSAERPA